MTLTAGQVAAYLPSNTRRFAEATNRCAQHLESGPGYISWSGGKDSTAVVRMALAIEPQIPVVLFDSGLEYPENLTYMRSLADSWALNFHIIPAKPDALTILADSGIWNHTSPHAETPDLHHTLITAPAAAAAERFGPHTLWGLRAKESDARRALLAPRQGVVHRQNGTTSCSPIWDWHDTTVWAYLAHQAVPENPVYTKLRSLGAPPENLRVGLMFDANNLNNGRMQWLRHGWPQQYEAICERLPRLREYR